MWSAGFPVVVLRQPPGPPQMGSPTGSIASQASSSAMGTSAVGPTCAAEPVLLVGVTCGLLGTILEFAFLPALHRLLAEQAGPLPPLDSEGDRA